MRNDGFIKNYTADAAIAPYRIAKFGTTDGSIAIAAASTDLLIGTVGRVYASVAGERVDVYRDGIAEVEYGGTVTRGQKLTADASGRAIAAAPAAGVNAQIIGIAEVSGVVGDIGSVLLELSVMQG
jgi:hypothetical protein